MNVGLYDSIYHREETGVVKAIATEPQQTTLAAPSTFEKLAADLRVIADERRLCILYLLTSGEQCVCEITEALGISQPLASHHLAVLREAGLVRDRRDARWVYYSISVERMREISERFGLLFDAERVRMRLAVCAAQVCSGIGREEEIPAVGRKRMP